MANTKWPGLLSWLLLCDLSSHFPGHVAPPTARDLAGVILNAARHLGGGQGPLKAVRALRQEWWEMRAKPAPADIHQLERDLKAVRAAVAAKLKPELLERFCERRELSWVDIEHTFCKITRGRK
jgi:hypothetical protein